MRDRSEPAFPRGPLGYDDEQPYGQQSGLTKREYYAAHALAGWMGNVSGLENPNWDRIADDCFCAADAMLARSRK